VTKTVRAGARSETVSTLFS